MKLTVPRKELHEALTIVGRAVAGNTTLAVLRNLLLEAGGGALKLAATDLEMGIELRLPVSLEAPGTLTVPAKALAEMVASLPEAEVSLEARPEGRDTLTVRCRRSEFRVPTLSAEDWPGLPEVQGKAEFSMPQRTLKGMLRQVLYAISDEQARPILTGVNWQVRDGRLTLAATDTHRLAVRHGSLSGLGSGEVGNWTAIVPGRPLSELLRVLSDEEGAELRVTADANQVQFATDRLALSSRLIDGQYPRYERVIPTSHTRRWTVHRDELLGALRRARIVARDATAKDRVILAIGDGGLTGDTLQVTAEGDGTRVHEELEVAREGEPTSVAINVGYLVETLQAMDTEGVLFELTEPLSPVLIRPAEGSDYLVTAMPMQVQ